MEYRPTTDYLASHTGGLASALEDWIRRALDSIANRPALGTRADDRSAAPSTAHIVTVNETLREYKNGISRLLRSAVRDSTRPTYLCSLPARALEQICRYLTLLELLTLSGVSRDFRALLLSIPQVWSEIRLHARGPWSTSELYDWTRDLIRRSNEGPLFLTMDISAVYMNTLWQELACNMHRIDSLTLSLESPCSTDITSSIPDFWHATLQALGVPAPRLRCAEIVVTEPRDVVTGARDVAYNPLPLSFSALSQLGHLQTLSLSGIRLPPESVTAAYFPAVTCFSYCSNGPILVQEIARVMTMMPLLVTLGLSANSFDAPDSALEAGSSDDVATAGTARAPTNLRNLFLAGPTTNMQQFCRAIPFASIRNLDTDVLNSTELIGAAYTSENIIQAVIAWAGITIVVKGSAATTVIRSYRPRDRFPQLLSGCSNLTSIALHEFHWFDDTWVILPPFPALTTLFIQLATCLEHASMQYQWPGTQRIGVFNISADATQWQLPNLQHLHVSAPRISGATCGYEDCLGRCSPSMSVSLRDIGRFVRFKLAFDAPQLVSITFAGLRFVDPDLDVARDELNSLANSFEAVTAPETVPHMDLPFFSGYRLDTLFAGRDGADA